jgi:predicted ATP-dependent endonuclease of OLD family
VDIEDDITTLVGKNESGKTSFLQAIERISDEQEFKDRELRKQAENLTRNSSIIKAKISGSLVLPVDEAGGAEINFESLEIAKNKDGSIRTTPKENQEDKYIIKEAGIRSIENSALQIAPDDQSEEILNLTRQQSITDVSDMKNLTSNILDKLDGYGLTERTRKMTFDEIKEYYNNLDYIISVTNSIPNIRYKNSVKTVSNSCRQRHITNDENDTFRSMLSFGGIEYDSFGALDPPKRAEQIDRAEEQIQKEINALWGQKSIEPHIQYDSQSNEFWLLLKDVELRRPKQQDSEADFTSVERDLIKPSERSRGFQWFFSFFVDQAVESEDDPSKDTVYLLDDPAVYLHPEGKKDWLETIEDLAGDDQYIYSSHSPFLIDETRPSRLRIVEDRHGEGTKVTNDIFEGDRSTLEPLRHTLGIGLGDSPFVNRRKIIVEGPSDYYILKGVLNYLEEHDEGDVLTSDEVTVFPADGADEMPKAAKWMHSEEFDFCLLLDHDQEAKDVEEDVEENRELVDEDEHLFFLHHDRAKQDFNVEIEDMFHPEFYLDCLNEVYTDEAYQGTIEDGDNDIEDLSTYEPITAAQVGDEDERKWTVGEEQEYVGMKIVPKIEAAFENQGFDGLEVDKLRVAKVIKRRLDEASGVHDEDIRAFKQVLGPMNAVLYDD